MRARETAVDIAAGIIGGLVATQVNGFVEQVFWKATPDSEKAREPETRDKSSADAAARKLLECVEEEPPEQQRQLVKKGIHFGLGAGWGPLYCWLRRHANMPPAAAAVTSGAALSLVVDETLNSLLRITPPPRAYPASTHVRGLLTHVVWGLVCGAVAEPLRRKLSSPRGGRT
ncbi:MAG TPA: hypothetical protein VF275_11465 [Gammaproteobacteria bacterium]